jgi:hypothetical protein
MGMVSTVQQYDFLYRSLFMPVFVSVTSSALRLYATSGDTIEGPGYVCLCHVLRPHI